MKTAPLQEKRNMLISAPATPQRPKEVKNCIISWPEAKPEPIMKAMNAPAYLITVQMCTFFSSIAKLLPFGDYIAAALRGDPRLRRAAR